MRVSIHQPNYIPWMGYFHKVKNSDVHVFLDDVEYSKNGFTNRNKILMNNASTFLTIPISKKYHNCDINKVIIDDKRWITKHLKTIKQSYSKSPYFSLYYDEFVMLLENPFENLSTLNSNIIKWMASKFGIETRFVISSKIGKNQNLRKTALLIDLLEALEADVYLSGKGAKVYLEENQFKNIDLKWVDFKHPRYSQASKDFVENLSALDLLFNHGPDSGEFL